MGFFIMRFTVLSHTGSTETESDYETAVDLVHATLTTFELQMKSERGLIVELKGHEISRTSSSMEPDFDVFEATGEVRYRTSPNDDSDSYEKSAVLRAYSPVLPPVMSPSDWAAWNTYQETGEAPEEDLGLLRRLMAYENYLEADLVDGRRMESQAVSLPFDAIDAWLNLAEGTDIGDAFDLPASGSDLEMLESLSQATSERLLEQQTREASNDITLQQFNAIQVRASLPATLALAAAASRPSPAAVIEPVSPEPQPASWLKRLFRP